MGFINLSKMPNPPTTRVSSVPSLSGGLNIHDIPWRLNEDQSPELKNMWWQDGALRSRPNQITYNNGAIRPISDKTNQKYESANYARLYHGWYVFHCNNRFYAVSEDLEYFSVVGQKDKPQTEFVADFQIGTFFLHNDVLYYKAKGVYISITVGDSIVEGTGNYELIASSVEAYVPTILMNADPATKGEGDLYQPVNRLTNQRRVLYNCGPETKRVILPEYASEEDITAEYMTTAGEWEALKITVTRSIVQNKVYLDFEAVSELSEEGSNNVRVTYSVSPDENDNLYEKLMDCHIAEVYGGGDGFCVVLAGCSAQPNAYFWSANTDVAMHPGYFPAEHYNLAGDASDPITGFGKQQNMLVIFQKNSIGRSVFSTADIDGRTFITMDYTIINPLIGCDLPKTIQLVENNLVFANKRRGVMLIKDTTSAFENNIVAISRNVERPSGQAGLLYDVQTAPETVCSLDDGRRYWICANGHAWLWDYSLGGSLSDVSKLSWFYFDNIHNPTCWFGYEDMRHCFLGQDGYFREFQTVAADVEYEDGTWRMRADEYDKIITLPIQNFNTYEVLKNVEKVIFVVQGNGNAIIDIEYETDYEIRKDLTPIMTHGWALVPRDLSFRNLKVFHFAVTAVRKPNCMHIRHFMVRLKNSGKGEGVVFVSAQIYYTLQGVDR